MHLNKDDQMQQGSVSINNGCGPRFRDQVKANLSLSSPLAFQQILKNIDKIKLFSKKELWLSTI